jgi:hypothetical protein
VQIQAPPRSPDAIFPGPGTTIETLNVIRIWKEPSHYIVEKEYMTGRIRRYYVTPSQLKPLAEPRA